MKTAILISAIAILSFCTLSTSKGQDLTKKLEKAIESLEESKLDLLDAEDYLNIVQGEVFTENKNKFKKETIKKINANEKIITEYKAKVSKMKTNDMTEVQIKLAVIEQKNKVIKKKFSTLNEVGSDDWESFTIEFNQNMNEMEKAIKELSEIY